MVDAKPENDVTVLHTYCSCQSIGVVEGDHVVCKQCGMPYQVITQEVHETEHSFSITQTSRDAVPSDLGR